MDRTTAEPLVKAIQESPVMAKLEAMARDLAGVALLVFVRDGDQIEERYATGRAAVLPEFCRIVRGSAEGRKRCAACRQLIAFGACYRGLSEFSCHGGVSLIAAPGASGTFKPSELLVVTTCALAHADPKKGWKAARAHAQGLPLDMGQLAQAYRALPALTDGNAQVVRAIVDAAAAVVNEIQQRLAASGTLAPSSDGCTEQGLEATLGEALNLARTPDGRSHQTGTENALIPFVVAMISHEPALPFRVASVARAVRMTPNHLSMLFTKHNGETFVSFLNGKRMELAKKLLGDMRLTVSEVAHQSGFRDASYFGKRFKEATGHTPGAWRRRRHSV